MVIFFACLGLLAAPPTMAGTDPPRPSATLCPALTDGTPGCITGTIGTRPPVCDLVECRVNVTADLHVTPIACGWMSMQPDHYGESSFHVCALDLQAGPQQGHREETFVYSKPGQYTVIGRVCGTEPSTTLLAPCERLWQYFVIPGPGSPPSLVESLPRHLSGGPVLVYESDTFRIYEGILPGGA